MGLIIPDSGEIFPRGRRLVRGFSRGLKEVMNVCSGLSGFSWCLTMCVFL